MRRCHVLLLCFLISAGYLWVVPSGVQAANPSSEPSPGKPPVVPLPDIPEGWWGWTNPYIGIAVRSDGTFYIYTTGGDPTIVGDENKPLLYPNATAFVTYRHRLSDFYADTGARNWQHALSNEVTLYQTSSACNDLAAPNRCAIETRYHLGCQLWAIQALSFMRNPYTMREDMVRITYGFEQRATRCTDVQINEMLVGVRLMLDTMVGGNDEASFLIPGIGSVTTEAELDGATPAFFRVFEDPELAPGSLQAIGYLHVGGNYVNTPWPPKFQIASWMDIADSEWAYDTRADKPHGDSAVAVYWPLYNKSIGAVGESLLRFEVGYGLAPPGGVDMWSDAPAFLNDAATFGADTWVNNSSGNVYQNGKVSLSLPPAIVVRPGAAALSGDPLVQNIGDLAPGATVHRSWPLEIMGGPGMYSYTTTTEFASGQVFTDVDQISLQPGIKFEQADYRVTETAGFITITVERANSVGGQVSVNVGTTGGSAQPGEDYTPFTTTLTFDAATNRQSFTIAILDDSKMEGDEGILLTLTDPLLKVGIVEQGQVAVTIVDDEYIPLKARLFVPYMARSYAGPPPLPGQREWSYHKSADGAHPDPYEQQMVWLMNRARANPTQEGIWLATTDIENIVAARRYYNVDTVKLQQEFADIPPRPPAAFDVRLYNDAYAHSLDLIARDAQDHENQFVRVRAAGFVGARYGIGSVYAYSQDAIHGHAGLNIDWGPEADGMQTNRGHRGALMSLSGYSTNVGIAMAPENGRTTQVGPLVTTANYFYASSRAADHYNRFIVGTVWSDGDGDGMYSPGEGIDGVRIVPDRGGFYAITGDAGGYTIPVTEAGVYILYFDLGNVTTRSVEVGNDSVLVDMQVSPASVDTAFATAAPVELPAPREDYVPHAPGPPILWNGE